MEREEALDYVPISFRLSPAGKEAIKKGSKRFGMSQTKWIEWLAQAAVSGSAKFVENDQFKVTVTGKDK